MFGATAYDITPAGFVSTAEWSLARWGSYVLAAPKGGKLYVWTSNVAAPATEVTQAPDQITSMIVTPERQVLALGCNEEIGGAFNPMCNRGSDIEDFEDWTTTPSNNAFEHIVGGAGPITAGRVIGPYIGVWTQTGLFLGSFLGDPAQTYRFDPAGDHADLGAQRMLVIHNATAWWLTIDGFFRTYTVGGSIEPIPCPIYEDLFDHAASQAIFGVYMPKYEEV